MHLASYILHGTKHEATPLQAYMSQCDCHVLEGGIKNIVPCKAKVCLPLLITRSSSEIRKRKRAQFMAPSLRLAQGFVSFHLSRLSN